MLSGVTVQVGEASETFRLTTRAMRALEDWARRDWVESGGAPEDAPGLIQLISGLEKSFRIETVVRLIAECAADGQGVDLARADEIVDAIGLQRAGEVVSEAVEKAFPEAAGKNRKRADQSA